MPSATMRISCALPELPASQNVVAVSFCPKCGERRPLSAWAGAFGKLAMARGEAGVLSQAFHDVEASIGAAGADPHDSWGPRTPDGGEHRTDRSIAHRSEGAAGPRAMPQEQLQSHVVILHDSLCLGALPRTGFCKVKVCLLRLPQCSNWEPRPRLFRSRK